jgi:hypothetical protein
MIDTDTRPAPRVDPALLRALHDACHQVRRARAAASPEPDAIDMPEPSRSGDLQIAGPLYLTAEYDAAGLIRTAELVAGLFAAGSITIPLGPVEALVNQFWHNRQQRLSAEERVHLLAGAFDPHVFPPLMQALCQALGAEGQVQAPPGIQAQVTLQTASDEVAACLEPHLVGMVVEAVPELLDTLTTATHILRDRRLQMAFGAPDLWALLGVVGRASGMSADAARHHAELGKSGAVVLGWLAQGTPFDPATPAGQQTIAAAVEWLLAWPMLGSQPAAASIPTPVPAPVS